jgi:plasmid stabilization system protein ParE
MFEIIWLPQAENDFDNIVDYLQKNWGEIVVEEFILN